ncbi:hypothetical protein ACISU4_35045, partial [Streptomyces wuyuanensis]
RAGPPRPRPCRPVPPHTARTGRAAHLVRQRLTDEGPEAALLSLSPSSARPAGPSRVVFDKVHHAVISPARTPLLLIPTRYGARTCA